MADLERTAPPKRRGDRTTLSVADPRTKKCLAALDLSGCDVADLTRFGNRLHRERGQITKLDAEMMWRRELAGAGAK